MIVYIALALLLVWLLGVIGVYPGGQTFHLLLLVGLLFLLIGFVKHRDAVARRDGNT
jgi:hypothetical protein